MRAARPVYGMAAIAIGIVDLVWGAFDAAHQPIQAFGNNVPGRQIFAYVIAALLVAGGVAILNNRSVRFGAPVLAIVYLIFVVFWLPRFRTAPLVLGSTPAVYIGVLGGVCQQVIVISAAVILYASASPRSAWAEGAASAARWLFGLSSMDFGLAHLTGIAADVVYVPPWMPLGREFWVALTGTAFVLAGIAMTSGILDVLAARLLALMFLVFSALTLIPMIFADPHDQTNWGGNAYNIIAVASAWILAEWLAARRPDLRDARISQAVV